MKPNYNVAFYSESTVVGGHERMALSAQLAIQKRFNNITIQWLIPGRDAALANYIERSGQTFLPIASLPKGSASRNPFRQLARLLRNAAILRRLSPGLVVVIQGNIILSCGGILSSLLGRVPYCSYIPMGFEPSSIGSPGLRSAAKLLAPILYRLVSSYIAIDSSQAEEIRRINPRASVVVVENHVPGSKPVERTLQARDSLRIPPDRSVLTLIGRIEFDHKCQDWILREFKDDPFLHDKFVLFVGDGTDSGRLQAMLTSELGNRFGWRGWTDNIRDIYAATDVLLIPSKNEGVPLVMLEALGYRIPVVGSDRNGMRTWLPSQWRFQWGDKAGFQRAVEQALVPASSDVWADIDRRLESVHSADRFASEFRNALERFLEAETRGSGPGAS